MTIDDKPDNKNIITLLEYLHNITESAITPYNKHALITWYKKHKRQLQKQYSKARAIAIEKKQRKDTQEEGKENKFKGK